MFARKVGNVVTRRARLGHTVVRDSCSYRLEGKRRVRVAGTTQDWPGEEGAWGGRLGQRVKLNTMVTDGNLGGISSNRFPIRVAGGTILSKSNLPRQLESLDINHHRIVCVEGKGF